MGGERHLKSLKASQTGVGCCLPQVGALVATSHPWTQSGLPDLQWRGEQAPVCGFWKKMMPDIKEKEPQINVNYCLTLELPRALCERWEPEVPWKHKVMLSGEGNGCGRIKMLTQNSLPFWPFHPLSGDRQTVLPFSNPNSVNLVAWM